MFIQKKILNEVKDIYFIIFLIIKMDKLTKRRIVTKFPKYFKSPYLLNTQNILKFLIW